jgi:hypothetical protein
MMGCVDYPLNPLANAWACDSDGTTGTKGHIADYAGEYCPGGRLDYTWAWMDGSSCQHIGVPYTWGYGVR